MIARCREGGEHRPVPGRGRMEVLRQVGRPRAFKSQDGKNGGSGPLSPQNRKPVEQHINKCWTFRKSTDTLKLIHVEGKEMSNARPGRGAVGSVSIGFDPFTVKLTDGLSTPRDGAREGILCCSAATFPRVALRSCRRCFQISRASRPRRLRAVALCSRAAGSKFGSLAPGIHRARFWRQELAAPMLLTSAEASSMLSEGDKR